MNGIIHTEKGISLVEVLVSLALIVVLWLATSTTLLSGQFFTSYAQHKAQAVFVAQNIIEQQRRLVFANLASQASAAVSLDSKGTYGTGADDFMGNRIVTVAVVPGNANLKTVQVEVNWQEQIANRGRVTMREYFTTSIANDPVLK